MLFWAAGSWTFAAAFGGGLLGIGGLLRLLRRPREAAEAPEQADLDVALALPHGEHPYRPISRYPSSDLDLAFEVRRFPVDAAIDVGELRVHGSVCPAPRSPRRAECPGHDAGYARALALR